MMSADLARFANAYLDAWNRHDLTAIADLHDEDTVYDLHLDGAVPIVGREKVIEAFATTIELFPDLHFTERRVIFAELTIVAETAISATTSAGHRTIDAIDVWTLNDAGLMTRKDTYVDGAALQPAEHAIHTSG